MDLTPQSAGEHGLMTLRETCSTFQSLHSELFTKPSTQNKNWTCGLFIMSLQCSGRKRDEPGRSKDPDSFVKDR